jgi:septation ring formation regulator EzrA
MIKEYIRLKDVEETRKACDKYRALQRKLLAGRQNFNQMLATLKSRLKELEL